MLARCAGSFNTERLAFAINFKFVNRDLKQIAIENGVIKLHDGATGFMMIKREVIERIIMARPDLHYADAIGLDPKYDPYKYALFDTSIDEVTREYLSEDYHFCKLWRGMGGKIWADLSIKLDHTGYYKFAGDATKLKDNL